MLYFQDNSSNWFSPEDINKTLSTSYRYQFMGFPVLLHKCIDYFSIVSYWPFQFVKTLSLKKTKTTNKKPQNNMCNHYEKKSNCWLKGTRGLPLSSLGCSAGWAHVEFLA